MNDRQSFYARCRRQVSDSDMYDILAALRKRALEGEPDAARLLFELMSNCYPHQPEGGKPPGRPARPVRLPARLPVPNGDGKPPEPAQRPLPSRPEVDQDLRGLVGLVATLGPKQVKQLSQASGLGREATERIVRDSGCFEYSHQGLWVLSAKGEELVREGRADESAG